MSCGRRWPLLPARTASALTAAQSSAAGSAAACRLHAPSVADYKRFTMKRVEAAHYAIRGLPADRTRFHLCWGSWHGPHTTDLPMADIVDVLLAINAGAYSFEAANARHEHEWKVWRDVKLPDGKVILPGVVTHSTNVVEHPELVADRIVRFAEVVGRENVVASTDSASAAGSIRRSPGRSWTPSSRAPNWPRASSGARAVTVRSG